MSAGWRFTKWTVPGSQRGKTGFQIGAFMQATGKFFDALDTTRQGALFVFRQLARSAFSRIVARTPVDTGLAKHGWVLDDLIDNESQTRLRITNTVFYVIYLEYGWSKQAPMGMVRITLMELAEEVNSLNLGIKISLTVQEAFAGTVPSGGRMGGTFRLFAKGQRPKRKRLKKPKNAIGNITGTSPLIEGTGGNFTGTGGTGGNFTGTGGTGGNFTGNEGRGGVG